VPRLAEIQSLFRQGVLTSDFSRLAPLLAGGRYPEKRFAIHQRHYETSLVTALQCKYPATAWLVGMRFVTEAATRFVHEFPPQAPCIAEYGRGFPKFLSERPGGERTPYLYDFAELEWHGGHAAIAVDIPPVSMEQLSIISADALPGAILTLQPGVCYLKVSWPVDQLLKLYLNDSAPDRFSMESRDIWLEVRGARGQFQVNRLDAAEFIFRKSILEARSIGDAAERALDVDADFDPGPGVAALIAAGLVTAVTDHAEGSNS